MTHTEKLFACLSDEVYKEPGNNPREHRTERCGYTLVQGEIPAVGDKPAVSLTGKRWAGYRAPNQVDHVLAFRGTADRLDAFNGLKLAAGVFDHLDYMIDATVWSLQVMLYLARKHESEGHIGGLKFSVTDHSLGGTLAMGVVVLLHDIPVTAQRHADDSR